MAKRNPLGPGKKFVVVDVGVPGGRWFDETIYDGTAKADAVVARHPRKRLQVIDARWFTPAVRVLQAQGVMERDNPPGSPSYPYYTVYKGQIVSGWDYKEDAQEAKAELADEGYKGVKVYTHATVERKGLPWQKGPLGRSNPTPQPTVPGALPSLYNMITEIHYGPPETTLADLARIEGWVSNSLAHGEEVWMGLAQSLEEAQHDLGELIDADHAYEPDGEASPTWLAEAERAVDNLERAYNEDVRWQDEGD